MLKFSNANYMPKFELEEFKNRYSDQIAPSAEKALQILGKRTNAMFYFNSGVKQGHSNIVRILTTTKQLGIDVARTISGFVSDEPYHDTMRQIMLHDVSSPSAIPDISFCVQENGVFSIKKTELPYILLQDDRFLVAVLNKERYVEVYFYEKLNAIAA